MCRLSMNNNEASKAGPCRCAISPSFVLRAHLRAVAHWCYPGGSLSLNHRIHCSCLPSNDSCEPVAAWSLRLPLVGQQLFPQPFPAPGEGPWGPRGGTPLALLASYQNWEKTTYFKKTHPSTNPSPLPLRAEAGGELLFLPGGSPAGHPCRAIGRSLRAFRIVHSGDLEPCPISCYHHSPISCYHHSPFFISSSIKETCWKYLCGQKLSLKKKKSTFC